MMLQPFSILRKWNSASLKKAVRTFFPSNCNFSGNIEPIIFCFVYQPNRILEALNTIKAYNPPAPYINKKAVVDILKQAVKNGANTDYHRQHVDNIRNMTGKQNLRLDTNKGSLFNFE